MSEDNPGNWHLCQSQTAGSMDSARPYMCCSQHGDPGYSRTFCSGAVSDTLGTHHSQPQTMIHFCRNISLKMDYPLLKGSKANSALFCNVSRPSALIQILYSLRHTPVMTSGLQWWGQLETPGRPWGRDPQQGAFKFFSL